jgi:hypothetical protein
MMARLRDKMVALLSKLGGLSGGPSDVAPQLELWEAKAEALIQAQIAAIKAQGDDERKDNSESYEEFLEGDPANWLVKWSKETADHFASRIKVGVDFCSWLIEILSSLNVIDDGPKRQFVDDPLLQRRLHQWWRGWEKRNSLNWRYAAVDGWVRFHGTMLLEARFTQGDALRPRPWVKMIPHRPQYIDVMQDPAEPSRAQAVRVFAGRSTNTSGAPRMLYHLWTADYLAILEDYDVLQVVPNIYGFLPFIRVTNKFDEDRFFVEGLSDKLVPFNLELNRLLAGLADDIEHLSGQPVLNSAGDAPPYCGSDTFIVLHGKDEWFKREGSNTDIAGKLAGIQKLLDLWTVSFNLPAGFLTANPFEGGVRELSGVAIVASQIGLNEDRERRQAIFRPLEADAVEMTGAIWRRHTGQDVRATDFAVAYPSVSRNLVSQTDRRENLRLELENNLVPPWEALKELRPGMSDAAARVLVTQAEAHRVRMTNGRGREETGRAGEEVGAGEENRAGPIPRDGTRGEARRGDRGTRSPESQGGRGE